MNIVPKLNLNKHPKDSINLSLVNALNVKVSHDESCITSEDSIKENVYIHNYLGSYYDVDYKIVGIIPCNNELVIIVKPSDTISDADIFRYQEPINNNLEQMYCAYGGDGNTKRFKYLGGLIKGAFTYNVENSLVIAITEYNVPNVKIPLRTINLGNAYDSSVYNDSDLSNAKLSGSPEVRMPNVINLSYVAGGAYKGWYYMFIRYKINTVDYTQWHSIGVPIYVDSLEQYQLIRYAFNRDTKFAANPLTNIIAPANPDDGYGAGCSDYFSNTSDISKETFKVDLTFVDEIDYTQYQIGLICTSKSYTKAFKTSDIYLDKNFDYISGIKTQHFLLDNKALSEFNVNDLITDTFNYYNVKNVINYQNRLYISNYSEDNANDDNVLQSKINAITVEPIITSFEDYGMVYDTALITGENTGVNQYDTYDMTIIPLHKYLGVDEETPITLTAAAHPTKIGKVGQVYIVTGGAIPGFAYVQFREAGGLGTTINTDFGKEPTQTKVYLSMPTLSGSVASNIIIDTSKIAIDGGMRYINTNISFKERKKESSLIPGEVYNFFIHYVNEYNTATNGYKLRNNTIWDTIDAPNVEIIPVPFNFSVDGSDFVFYAAMPVGNNVSFFDFSTNSGYNINVENAKYYKDYTGSRLSAKAELFEENAFRDAFIRQYSSYANEKHATTKWYQVSYGPEGSKFHLFINNNGDRLFKVPTVTSFQLGFDGFPGEVTDFKTFNRHTLVRMVASNIEIPAGYVGYYLSYELFEPQVRVTGLLTRNDFRSQDYITVGSTNTIRGTLNTKKSDKMLFYSGQFDIADSIKLDYNIMRIEAVNCFKKTDIPAWDYFQRNQGFSYVHDMNKPQTGEYGADTQLTYSMPEYKLAVADSAVDNRIGMGTALQIKDSYNLFPNYDTDASNNNKINLYRVSLLNTTRDIYMSNTKKLVKMTDIFYRAGNVAVDYKYSTGYIDRGYNGHYSYDGFLVYENAGVSFNTTTNKVTRSTYNDEYYQSNVDTGSNHTYQNDIPFAAYVQMPICSEVFFESKSFKNESKPIIYVVKNTGGEGGRNLFAKGSMITPANSIDLFENRQGTSDQFNPKTYSNYRLDLVSIEQFDKTLRRSNVIQDESRANGWRTFPVEAYKNIAENKGKITNLIGIGTLLLVHTEHSLFAFNIDNTLRTQDRDVQLLQPDVFETNYQEVFTSDKGFGGLQDDKSFLVDQFGYIFYSEDTHRIYLFDNKQLDYIDDDILQWLIKYKPVNVRMANDKENNRILIKFDYTIANEVKHLVLSYSYKSKSFISPHSYYFDEAYNTKTGLYLQCANDHVGCSLHSFTYGSSLYGQYDNILGSLGTSVVREAKLSIIVNSAFDVVKFLEYITYKLTKYKDDTGIDFTNSPVEEYVEPFAGNTIKVYNNQINTGVLDINVNTEAAKNVFADFNKPYWDLGVWNYSYLHNRVSELNTGVSANDMSRLFGNYFIIEFVFDNIDGRRIDFEELNYNISEDN